MADNSQSSTTPRDGENTKLYACITCVQRKVKCDKRQPCFSCFRSSLACKYRTTPPSQRRKRKAYSAFEERFDRSAKQSMLLERLRSHEAALRKAGVAFDSFLDEWNANETTDEQEDEESSLEVSEKSNCQGEQHIQRKIPHQVRSSEGPTCSTRLVRAHRGALLPEYGGKRYYDHGFIGVLGQEYRQNTLTHPASPPSIGRFQPAEAAADMMAASIQAHMTKEVPLEAGQQCPLHPPSAARMKYLAIFLENVHPLTKIVYTPSVEQLMSDNVSNSSPNMDNSKKNALMFSIYSCAVVSLTDKECQTIFGVSQPGLLEAFQNATRHALVEASFLKVPVLDVLRAQVLLLTSMVNNADHYSAWILMGSTIRMAQSQGLHRDGTHLGLPPFDVEMRRRLWWYIVALDSRLTEIIGAESSLIKSMDTQLPSNVNDDDLRPDMTTLPQDRVGATEMIFCLTRYKITAFLHEREYSRQESQASSHIAGASTNVPACKKGLSALESLLEEKYLRFCDPIIPVQLLTATMARSTLCKFKQMALHSISRQSPEDGQVNQQQSQQSQESQRRHPQSQSPSLSFSQQPPDQNSIKIEKKRQQVFSLAARNLQYDNLIHTNKSLHGFLWFVDFHIPWGGPVYILQSLAHQPDWDDSMNAAWVQIEEFYEHHPEYFQSEKVLHMIISGLTLKAWAAREAALTAKGILDLQPPLFIVALQAGHAHRSIISSKKASAPGVDMNLPDFGAFDSLNTSGLDLMDSFWAAGPPDWT